MPIKFNLFALLPTLVQTKHSWQKNKTFLPLVFSLCSIASGLMLQSADGAEPAVLGVVKSQENANQWAGITTRLQTAGVAYCVIELPSVNSAADLGDRKVVFLPNVETLTQAQALALEEWMSKGGRVIASGPVGSLSQPGVRQLLRSLLGAYWGFSLNTPSKLEPLRTKTQEWVRQAGLSGTVHGGVVIPTGITSQPAATWQSKDTPPAVVTTDRSTVLGWRWGVNAAASAELDSAWLRAAMGRYVQLPAATRASASGSPKNCNGTVATAGIPTAPTPKPSPPPQTTAIAPTPKPSPPPQTIAIAPTPKPSPPPQTTAIAPTPKPSTTPRPNAPSTRVTPNGGISTAVAPRSTAIPHTIREQSDDPLERLTPGGLQVVPNSKQPISNIDAIALRQELESLIGRFESAQLAANAMNGNQQQSMHRNVTTQVASNGTPPSGLPESALKAVAEAREIAKTLPQLVAQKNYAAARQEWLRATELLWKQYPTDRSLAQPEIRAMWLDRGSIVRAGSEQELAKIFDRLAASGINTVFFETVNAGYPIYPSEVAPQQNPLVRGWDPLASAVKLAHERGIELHAWVWVFAVGNTRHNKLLNINQNYPGPVITAHPDWASYDNRGSLFPPGQGKPFLDPANPEARRYLLRLLDEIVSRYQVDGLQLDYIRYPFQDPSAERTYGYGTAARQQFQQLTGVDPRQISPRDRVLWQKWTEFRTRQINTFVAEASQQLRQKRPNLIMSVAVFPLSEHDRIHKLQQHWEVWANRGDVDLIVAMTYALDTYRFQRLAQPWITSTKLGSALILPGIRLLNLPLSVALDQIQLSRDLPVSGYSLFAVENLTGDLQKIFNSTQGTSKEPVPYRQPFQAAVARYASLQREWSFLSENKQLWLRDQERSSFTNQAEVLKNALNQLAADPSPRQLAAAREALTAFQSQFKDWMRLHALENPYQVKVWQNRLATVDRLLRYGEQVVFKSKSPPIAEQP